MHHGYTVARRSNTFTCCTHREQRLRRAIFSGFCFRCTTLRAWSVDIVPWSTEVQARGKASFAIKDGLWAMAVRERQL